LPNDQANEYQRPAGLLDGQRNRLSGKTGKHMGPTLGYLKQNRIGHPYSAENLHECQKAGVSQVSIPQCGRQKGPYPLRGANAAVGRKAGPFGAFWGPQKLR
jgi:hypothetical protein